MQLMSVDLNERLGRGRLGGHGTAKAQQTEGREQRSASESHGVCPFETAWRASSSSCSCNTSRCDRHHATTSTTAAVATNSTRPSGKNCELVNRRLVASVAA